MIKILHEIRVLSLTELIRATLGSGMQNGSIIRSGYGMPRYPVSSNLSKLNAPVKGLLPL
jgi:hypothetical protein